MKAFFRALALAMALSGCSSFLHFSDPTVDDFVQRLCLGKAEEARPALEAESQRTGVPLEKLLQAFHAACLFRASRGLNEAGEAGMIGARSEAEAGHGPLTPENATPELKDPELEQRR